MHYSLAPIAGIVSALLLTSCIAVPKQADPAEVRGRYANRDVGECASWITSFRTGVRYCASPPFTVAPEPDLMAAASTPKRRRDGPVELASLQELGEEIYGEVCVACHQADGMGLPGSFPPLGGSGEFYGDAVNMAGIVVNGLSGEIVVQGQTYNGVMPPQGATLNDYEIAAVTTYVRTHFGNDDGMVTPDDVVAARGE